ncbi:MAG: hypothetical protein HKN33_04340 [Pyrinomonadaceae bacterium]|nr:hypothetical protein [Pyrinomonadaceae bacterium]
MRKQRSGCDYAENVVDYVYKELEGADLEAFESHLANCGSCPDEITTFVSITDSLGEWRKSVLATAPTLENPAAVAAGATHVTLGEQIRAFFSSSFMWQSASAFAALLLVAFLAFMFFAPQAEDNNKAQIKGTEEPRKKINTPRVEDEPEVAKSDSTEEPNSPGASDAQNVPPVTPQLAKTKEPASGRRIRPAKRTPKRTPKAKGPVKRNTNKKAPKSPDIAVPAVERLTEIASTDEMEDESLRLTDLFGADSDDR